jgi:hypothetical protein
MATQSRTAGESSSARTAGTQHSGSVGSPISNEAYNVITALQAKLEGLEAYRKYAQDADDELWRELTQADLGAIELLVNELERLVSEGKLRMREPGRANV